jgi:hypothetical protein
MTPALESALAACDDCGISLRYAGDGDRIIYRAGDGIEPDGLRDQLRELRPELVEVLRSNPRPDPDPVAFVARNLDVDLWPFYLVPTTQAVWRGDRPYHRLTPRVWVWLVLAVESKLGGKPGSLLARELDYEPATDRVHELGRWVAEHFRPDQIARAMQRRQPLPTLTQPPTVDGG